MMVDEFADLREFAAADPEVLAARMRLSHGPAEAAAAQAQIREVLAAHDRWRGVAR